VILRYTPDDGPAQRYDLSTIRFLTSEAETCERNTGQEWATLKGRDALVIRDSPTAKRALLWVLLKRDSPTLKFRDFDPAEADIVVRLDAAEGEEILAEAREQDLTEAQDTQALRELKSILDEDAMGVLDPSAQAPKEPPPAAAAPEDLGLPPVAAASLAVSAPAVSPPVG